MGAGRSVGAVVLWLSTAVAAEGPTDPDDTLLGDGERETRLTLTHRESLFGAWGGLRPWLRERGVEFELVHTAEWFWNTGGGLDQGNNYRADLSLIAELDTEAAGWWPNGEFFLHVQGQYGDGITEDFVGDFQVLSNIDDEDFFQLSELWYKHTLLDGRLWLKAGKIEANADFAFVDYGLEFLNSSPGFSPTIPLVTYPDPDWGIVLGIEPVHWFSMNVGVFQGRPDGSRSLGNTLDTLHGPMVQIEPVFHYDIAGRDGHLRLGFWWNGDNFERLGPEDEPERRDPAELRGLANDVRSGGLAPTFLAALADESAALLADELRLRFFGDDSEDDGTAGFYATWDQQLFNERPDDPDDAQGLGIFLQYGRSDEDVIEAETYFGGGLQWTGAIPGRDADIFGLGAFHVNFSDALDLEKDSETAIELFYRAEITPWISVKPDLQYIVHPGGNDVSDAFVVGLRVQLAF